MGESHRNSDHDLLNQVGLTVPAWFPGISKGVCASWWINLLQVGGGRVRYPRMVQDRERMKALLDARHQWPMDFIFKFIVPIAQQEAVKALFPPESIRIRLSSAGRYVSLTVTLRMSSSDEVLEVYARTAAISGLIAL